MLKTFALISTVLLAGGALAQSPVVVTREAAPFKVVSYSDLNLSSGAGQSQLVHRIRAAASDLCFEGNKEEVKFAMARRACYSTALNGGLKQMNDAIAARTSGTALGAATLVISGR